MRKKNARKCACGKPATSNNLLHGYECTDCRNKRRSDEVSYMTHTLRDPVTGKQFEVKARAQGHCLELSVKGYSDYGSVPDDGALVLLDCFDGRLRVHVYDDINNPEPTHSIDLEGAREERRAVPPPQGGP